MIQVGPETTVVTGRRVYGLRVADVDPPRTVRVTVVLDGRYEWTFDEPGWRPIAVGVGETGAYLWSARRVIGLPDDGGEPRIELEVDEDLIAVFWVGGGWVIVCETSVRRVVDQMESARIELGSAIESVLWADDDHLVLRDSDGSCLKVTVRGGEVQD